MPGSEGDRWKRARLKRAPRWRSTLQVEYSVYTMRQASRRSWRIGQRLPVRVIYFAYSGTLQAQALSLVAKKLKSSLVVEGELIEEGLATHGDQGDDMLISLARSLTDRTETNAGSLEALFAGVRAAEGEVEAALRPEDVEIEEEEEERTSLAAPREVVAAGAPTSVTEGEQLRLL